VGKKIGKWGGVRLSIPTIDTSSRGEKNAPKTVKELRQSLRNTDIWAPGGGPETCLEKLNQRRKRKKYHEQKRGKDFKGHSRKKRKKKRYSARDTFHKYNGGPEKANYIKEEPPDSV